MELTSGIQGISGLVRTVLLSSHCFLHFPPPPPLLPLLVFLCYKTYDSPHLKPLFRLTDSATDDNTILPSLSQECIRENVNCSSQCGPHGSGFNHCDSDSTTWLTQLGTHGQFHDQSLLRLLAELKFNLRTSRKGTVIGSPMVTIRTREEHISR